MPIKMPLTDPGQGHTLLVVSPATSSAVSGTIHPRKSNNTSNQAQEKGFNQKQHQTSTGSFCMFISSAWSAVALTSSGER